MRRRPGAGRRTKQRLLLTGEGDMEQKLHPQFEERASILKAMGHPTRLFILEELNKRERCVNELT